jgi:hypothetical protein
MQTILVHHFKYLSYVTRHKWFVLVAGLRTHAPLWRLLIHDWSKFLPSEWFAYANYFYNPPIAVTDPYGLRRDKQSRAFDVAWLHHQHANPHHWQHWILREDSGDVKILEMPEHFVREMIADWMGAGRAITGKWEAGEWYWKNRKKIVLHDSTRRDVEILLCVHAGLRMSAIEDNQPVGFGNQIAEDRMKWKMISFCALLAACDSPVEMRTPSAPEMLTLTAEPKLPAGPGAGGIQCLFNFTANAKHAVITRTVITVRDAGKTLSFPLTSAELTRLWTAVVVQPESRFRVLLGGTGPFSVQFDVESTAGNGRVLQVCT